MKINLNAEELLALYDQMSEAGMRHVTRASAVPLARVYCDVRRSILIALENAPDAIHPEQHVIDLYLERQKMKIDALCEIEDEEVPTKK